MSKKIYQSAAVMAAVTVLLAACGGGGGDGGSSTAVETPVASIATAGTISGLGSVIVNGVRYETVGSSVLDSDDQTRSITTPLAIGMTVEIEQNGVDATTQRAIASKIHVRGGIKGIANVSNGALSVSGLPVTTDTSTLVLASDGTATTLDKLQNATVEVYGLPQADGSYQATRVEAKAQAGSIRLVGTVASVNPTAATLVLGSSAQPVTVSYAGLDAVQGLVAGAVVSIEVSGAPGSYSATRLRVRSTTAQTYTSELDKYIGTTRKADERNELYGVISDKAMTASGCTFKVQSVPVQAVSAALCASITDGDYVEAKGMIVNGMLNATRIEFEGQHKTQDYSDDSNDSDSDGLRYMSLTPSTSNSSATPVNPLRSFEIYGNLNCSALNTACTLQSGTMLYNADLSSARWEHSQIVSGFVEVKGYLSGSSFKVVKIESKNSRD
ncbi:DUF5666 domain-containing protein [Malikia spinosa]|uniref:DUF5666 domain-containing protein n=1 Tax=Malikia spinosa TaxID=86180 RepID=A0A7C9JL57_9BURK|nr:DUF5666 domain-containing protein [Malikia spinosa]MYZ51866.1 hypothetical protein [Malikia spinosa]